MPRCYARVVVRDAFPAWTRRPVGLLLLALLLGACGVASADPDTSSRSESAPGVERATATVQRCSFVGTAVRKVAGVPSGPVTAASGAIRRLEGVAAAANKFTAANVTAAGVPVPATGGSAAVKIPAPVGLGSARVAGEALSALAAEPCA